MTAASAPNRVLADHVRVGKKLVPRFRAALGEWHETSWAKDTLPEVLWIALLREMRGPGRGTELAHALASAARSLRDRPPGWFTLVSTYASLTSIEQARILELLSPSGDLQQIQMTLQPLVALYPRFPLGFLWQSIPGLPLPDEYLLALRGLVRDLLDREHVKTIQTLATVFTLASRADELVFVEGCGFGDLATVDDYPETEESQNVASLVRALASGLAQESLRGGNLWWPTYFWNRGLELDRCSFAACD